MAWDYAAPAAGEGDSPTHKYERTQLESSAAARLSQDNQIGERNVKTISVALVSLEIVQSRAADKNESYEPVKELSFRTSPIHLVKAHGDIGLRSENLVGGGVISKKGDKIEIDFAPDNKIEFDAATGNLTVDSTEHYQKEVHYKGTDWQQTVLTSNADTKLVFGRQNINSIQRAGVLELFPRAFPAGVGCEPRTPASEELSQLLIDRGFTSLDRQLKRVDRQEIEAEKLSQTRPADRSSTLALAKVAKDRGLVLEALADALPEKSVKLAACAENQMRVALKTIRDEYGAGTPETQPYVEALHGLLKSSDDAEHREELERLEFEMKRANLLKGVVESIDSAPAKNADLSPESAKGVRLSLISIHIAGGDSALKNFVSDVNNRLRKFELIAPNETPGLLRHGAIIWTPEGATRYSGSFDINVK